MVMRTASVSSDFTRNLTLQPFVNRRFEVIELTMITASVDVAEAMAHKPHKSTPMWT